VSQTQRPGSTLTLYLDFASKEKNTGLGMALDGVNPFSNQSLSHSIWPIVFLYYNLFL
jgi:hypothetical protein